MQSSETRSEYTVRKDKIEKLNEMGIQPYAQSYNKEQKIGELLGYGLSNPENNRYIPISYIHGEQIGQGIIGEIQYVSAIIKNTSGDIYIFRNKKHGGRQVPSGKIENNESAIDTLRRELLEEIGSNIISYKELGTKKSIFTGGYIYTGTFFSVEIDGDPVILETEKLENGHRAKTFPAKNGIGFGVQTNTGRTIDTKDIMIQFHDTFFGYHCVLNHKYYNTEIFAHADIDIEQDGDIDINQDYIRYMDLLNKTYKLRTISEYKKEIYRDINEIIQDAKHTYQTAGRLSLFRTHGTLSFGKIMDDSGEIQIMFHRDACKLTSAKKSQTNNTPIDRSQTPLFDQFPIKESIDTIEKHIGIGILYNRKNDTYLCLDRSADGAHTFIGGAIEEGEDAIIGTMREIQEESGYKNVKYICELSPTRSYFRHETKKANYKTYNRIFVFELVDEERQAIDDEEMTKHKPIRIGSTQVHDFLHNTDNKIPMYDHMYSRNEHKESIDNQYILSGVEAYKFLEKMVDIGDFLGVRGELFYTHKGELTLFVSEFSFLVKALRPLGDKFHGISGQEAAYRQRYLDMIHNRSTLTRMQVRSNFIKALREFYRSHDFVEIETPILGLTASGAAAQPFVTHHNDFDIPMYLRIAPEIGLKMATVGGLERVFEIGKDFRNEGSSPSHHQEFTVAEHYYTYQSFEDSMIFTEKMFDYLFAHVQGIKKKVQIADKSGKISTVDFATPWKRIDYVAQIKEDSGIDVAQYTANDADALRALIKKQGFDRVGLDTQSTATMIDYLYKKVTRPKIIGPAFIYNYPKTMQPLARQSDTNPNIVEQYQVIVNGWEILKAYGELVDPIKQQQNFDDQAGAIAAGDQEATKGDDDFVKAMEYGMPCQSGRGMGIERILAMLTEQHNIRDVILFPMMKPEGNNDNIRKIVKNTTAYEIWTESTTSNGGVNVSSIKNEKYEHLQISENYIIKTSDKLGFNQNPQGDKDISRIIFILNQLKDKVYKFDILSFETLKKRIKNYFEKVYESHKSQKNNNISHELDDILMIYVLLNNLIEHIKKSVAIEFTKEESELLKKIQNNRHYFFAHDNRFQIESTNTLILKGIGPNFNISVQISEANHESDVINIDPISDLFHVIQILFKDKPSTQTTPTTHSTDNSPSFDETIRTHAEHIANTHLSDTLLHCQQVAHCMQYFAQKKGLSLEEQNYRYAVGLLHDIDRDIIQKDPSQHLADTFVSIIQAIPGLDNNIAIHLINDIRSHYPEKRSEDTYSANTTIRKYLLSVDELSGLMYAYARMRGGSFVGMEAKGVIKKIKDKKFAAGVDREHVRNCEVYLEIGLEDFVGQMIVAMQGLDKQQ